MLNRIRNLTTLLGSLAWRSISDTGVYLRVSLLPGRILIVYTLLAALIIALGHSAHFWIKEVPTFRQQANSVWTELTTQWPSDLTFHYKDNTWRMSSADAIHVPYPQALPRPEGAPQYLATLLPVEPETISAQIPSFFVAGPTTFFLQSPAQDQPQSFAWSEFLEAGQTVDITKDSVTAQTENFQIAIEFGLQQLTLLVFVWRFLGVWALRLFGLLLYAWLAQALWSFRGRKLKYGSVYKMGLLIIPVAELVMLIWKVFLPATAAMISFWWVWLIIMAAIVLSAPRK